MLLNYAVIKDLHNPTHIHFIYFFFCWLSTGGFRPPDPPRTLGEIIYFFKCLVFFGLGTLSSRCGSIPTIDLHQLSSHLDLMVTSYGHFCIHIGPFSSLALTARYPCKSIDFSFVLCVKRDFDQNKSCQNVGFRDIDQNKVAVAAER